MTIYINEQMNWTIHILKLLTENYYYGHLPYGHYYE